LTRQQEETTHYLYEETMVEEKTATIMGYP
jgi:hypothetical protein